MFALMVFALVMFALVVFALMRCPRQCGFTRVTFVLPEFLGVVMHGVTLMSALFLG
jgi:hypothetical protein